MPLFECLMNSNSKSLLLEFQIELCWCWCILEIRRSMTMLLSPSICPSVSGADILRQFLVLVLSVCREDVWVPGSLTDIHCSQIQIGPIKHSRQKTALIKDSQQSFNVNFLLFLTDSGTLKCPWRPWNLKYIGANFNIVALAWVSASLWAIHRDLTQSTGNIFKVSQIFIPIHVHLAQTLSGVCP